MTTQNRTAADLAVELEEARRREADEVTAAELAMRARYPDWQWMFPLSMPEAEFDTMSAEEQQAWATAWREEHPGQPDVAEPLFEERRRRASERWAVSLDLSMRGPACEACGRQSQTYRRLRPDSRHIRLCETDALLLDRVRLERAALESVAGGRTRVAAVEALLDYDPLERKKAS
jgi:hypothetical protein